MGLLDSATQAFHGVVGKIRRNAIAYAICGISAVAIVILATGAGIMALIPLVGAVYAQLIAAGVFLAVIVGTLIWLQRSSQAQPVRAAPIGVAATDATQRQMQFAQIAMIIEAVMLGYSMSRRR